MAIPIGNHFVKRVFSIMHNIMTDKRNRLSVDLIKAEICTKVNYSMSCTEFYNVVSNNQSLILAAKSNQKYNFRKNN